MNGLRRMGNEIVLAHKPLNPLAIHGHPRRFSMGDAPVAIILLARLTAGSGCASPCRPRPGHLGLKAAIVGGPRQLCELAQAQDCGRASIQSGSWLR